MPTWLSVSLGILVAITPLVALIVGQNFKLTAVSKRITQVDAKLDLLIKHLGDSGTDAERQALMDKLTEIKADVAGTI